MLYHSLALSSESHSVFAARQSPARAFLFLLDSEATTCIFLTLARAWKILP